MQVFISYKWEGDEHNLWVEKLARDLRIRGIDALLDKWEVRLGESFTEYMTRSINLVDVVLFVMTPLSIHAVEAPSPSGGAVKFEVQLATARKIAGEKFRFIGILRKGDRPANQLRDFRYADFRNDEKYSEMLETLVMDLVGETGRPPLGSSGVEKDFFEAYGEVGVDLKLERLRAEFMAASKDLVVWNESMEGPHEPVFYFREAAGKYHCEELPDIQFATRIVTTPARDLVVIREREGVFVFTESGKEAGNSLPIETVDEPIIRSEVVHPKLPIVVVGTDYGKILAWDYKQGKVIFEKRYFPRKDIVWISGLAIDAVAEQVLFCIGNDLYRVSLHDGQVASKTTLGASVETGALAINRDLDLLAVGGMMSATVYKGVADPHVLHEVPITNPLVASLQFSSSGNLLGIVSGLGFGGNGAVIVESTSGKVLKRFYSTMNSSLTFKQFLTIGVRSISFASDDTVIATGEGERIGLYKRADNT